MERPHKHHYIPVFYLQQRADEDGGLLKFSRPYGPAVKHEPTSPRKTGYQRGLFSGRRQREIDALLSPVNGITLRNFAIADDNQKRSD